MPDYRELKNRVRYSSTLDKDVYQRVKDYSEKSGVPLSKIFDRALTAYMESVGK